MFLGSTVGVESLVAQIQASTLFLGAEQLLHRSFGTLDLLTLEEHNTSGEFSDHVVRWLTFVFLLVLKFLDFLSKGSKKKHFCASPSEVERTSSVKQGSPVLLVIWLVVVLQGLRPSYPLYTVQKLLKVMVQA